MNFLNKLQYSLNIATESNSHSIFLWKGLYCQLKLTGNCQNSLTQVITSLSV